MLAVTMSFLPFNSWTTTEVFIEHIPKVRIMLESMTDPLKDTSYPAVLFHRALENSSPLDKVGLAYLAARDHELYIPMSTFSFRTQSALAQELSSSAAKPSFIRLLPRYGLLAFVVDCNSNICPQFASIRVRLVHQMHLTSNDY